MSIELSEEAKSALVNVGSNKIGATARADMLVLADLMDAGLIGRNGGLTRRGSITRERLVNQALESAFG